MTHFIAMGGEHGCLPDNCAAYRTLGDAVEGLDSIYELSRRQRANLNREGITELRRDQGGAYCEVSECDCSSPWEHAEFDGPENWPEYAEEPEEGDYIIADKCVYEHNGKWKIDTRKMDTAAVYHAIRKRMDADQYWPNVWNLSDHGNLSLVLDLDID